MFRVDVKTSTFFMGKNQKWGEKGKKQKKEKDFSVVW
jgi:hypothetical protein